MAAFEIWSAFLKKKNEPSRKVKMGVPFKIPSEPDPLPPKERVLVWCPCKKPCRFQTVEEIINQCDNNNHKLLEAIKCLEAVYAALDESGKDNKCKTVVIGDKAWVSRCIFTKAQLKKTIKQLQSACKNYC